MGHWFVIMAQSNQKRKEFVGSEKQRGSVAMMAAAGCSMVDGGVSGTKSFTVIFTRHALYGGVRPLYGSFAGK